MTCQATRYGLKYWKEKLKNGGRAYKYLNIVDDSLMSPYKYYVWCPGEHEVDLGYDGSVEEGIVREGFHVYLEEDNGDNQGDLPTFAHFEVHADDLVCVDDDGHAVFRKVTLTEESYHKALGFLERKEVQDFCTYLVDDRHAIAFKGELYYLDDDTIVPDKHKMVRASINFDKTIMTHRSDDC